MVNFGFEGSDHLNVALEMTVVIREPLEVCVVIRLEEYQQEIKAIFCFYFLEDVKNEIFGRVAKAWVVPVKAPELQRIRELAFWSKTSLFCVAASLLKDLLLVGS